MSQVNALIAGIPSWGKVILGLLGLAFLIRVAPRIGWILAAIVVLLWLFRTMRGGMSLGVGLRPQFSRQSSGMYPFTS